MRIAIASDDGVQISAHFGRTLGFALYDLEDGKINKQEYRPNTFTGHAHGAGHGQGHEHGQHGHGPQMQHSHGPILDALGDCHVVIANGMGRRIYVDLENAGKKVFITDETDVENAAQCFADGTLQNFPGKGCQHPH
jgi:predicted Fe-Mo cluster-binding NifX family protein